MSVNKVILLGNVGGEIQMKHFEGGGIIGRLSLATNETYTNKSSGERITNTEWHNVIFKNKTAEVIEKYVKKGDQLFVEGSLKTRKWQDASGQDKYMVEIHAMSFSFVGNSQQTNQSEKPIDAIPVNDDEQDDLPF